MSKALKEVAAIMVVVLCLSTGIIFYANKSVCDTKSNDFEWVAKCDYYEGCKTFTVTFPAEKDKHGLIVPPGERRCPKCLHGISWYFYHVIDGVRCNGKGTDHVN
ncbi:MAG: hypothetical protein JRD89_19665 [Deltaproteobacteria bacterium]|nr:hypothetical protein [Deltaproteobacteria bacterium]